MKVACQFENFISSFKTKMLQGDSDSVLSSLTSLVSQCCIYKQIRNGGQSKVLSTLYLQYCHFTALLSCHFEDLALPHLHATTSMKYLIRSVTHVYTLIHVHL
jgi:hypothetical protein